MREYHPRPQLVREGWWSLDGEWDYCADPDAELLYPDEVKWDAARPIQVPYAPEAPASGIGDENKCRAHWYRRRVDIPAIDSDDRLVLRFGAVDYHATVWVDGARLTDHEGGYSSFSVDVPSVAGLSDCEVVVRAYDDPDELDKPRGKQTWRTEAHSIWYPRTSGIWRSVWLERVPACAVESLRWTGNLDKLEVGLEVTVSGSVPSGASLAVRLSLGDRMLVDDTAALFGSELRRRFGLGGPGQPGRDALLWSPQHPTLIDARVEVRAANGAVVDAVQSYTGLRSVEWRNGKFMLNGRPRRLRLVLDQGYWPETGATPPDSDALRRDIELTKSLGFNGVRKHQKVEDPRYLAWADRLGLLVWSELPSAQRFSDRLVRRASAEWGAVVVEHRHHPCVIAWVPFNESWGVPEVASRADQQAFVRALTELTHALDGTRPVVSNDGWEAVGGDVIGIHDYDGNAGAVRERYADEAAVDRLLGGTGPAGRALVVDRPRDANPPVLVTELGGISLTSSEGESWGYHKASDGDDLAARYAELVGALRASPVLAGFCYTQLTDTYQEANGLLTMHRAAKAPVDAIRRANLRQ